MEIKRMTILREEIPIQLYNSTIIFLIGKKEDMQDYVKSIIDPTFVIDFDCFDAITINNEGTCYILLDSDSITLSTIGHEICHAVYFIFGDVGLDLSNSEAFAYLWGYIFEKITLCITPDAMAPIKIQLKQEDEQQLSSKMEK